MIYITGIAGFIGSNVANELYKRGYDVTGCDNLQFGYHQNINPVIKWNRQSFTTISEQSLTRYNILVHCATCNIIFSMDNPIKTFKTNALDTIKLFNKFKHKIIYTSTASIYGNSIDLPTKEKSLDDVTNAYDQSKLIAEEVLKLRGNYTTLRLSNVFGKNQRPENPYCGVVAKFIKNIEEKKPIEIIGDGIATRDFTYIDDTVNAIIKAIDTEALNTEINISSGVETSIINLAFKINEIYGTPLNLTFKDKRQIDGIDRRWLDISKAKELLNWEPTWNFEDALKQTINDTSIHSQA